MKTTVIRFVLRFYDILLAGFYTLVLVYVAALSVRQSIVLAVLFTGLAHGIGKSVSKPTVRFRPYQVRIVPDLYQILWDFQMIRATEEWTQLQAKFNGAQPPFGSIWGYGISFAVISESEDRERTLIYSNSHKCFVSEVQFEEDLSPFKIERIDKAPSLPDYQDVSLFLRPGSGGYDLGISVPDKWWHLTKQSCPKPIREQENYATGYVNLVLATISYREFDGYREPAEWEYNHMMKWTREIDERRTEQRKRLGWEVPKQPDFPELCISWPDALKNSYFRVEHRAI